MGKLNHLKPTQVWENFEALCNIPRPSKKEEKVIKFMKEFGEKLGLKTIVDEVGNVIIKKPATKGMENRLGIILQGHIDMVPQKNSDKVHDFEKDPIVPWVDGDWVKATGTTLGADNGLGVSATMAILQSKDIAHGPIEALLTIDEETGMTGAFGLKSGVLDGDILLNLDSEDEGELYVGCAGGIDASIKFNYKEEEVSVNHTAYKLLLTGLKGGHSGLEIILYRGNSNKLMNRFLKFASKKFNVRISSIEGGSLRNAIPRESFVTVVVPNNNEAEFLIAVSNYEKIYRKEFSDCDPDIKLVAEKTSAPNSVIDLKTQNELINTIYSCPNGVIRMSDSMKGMVETSTNLAIVKSNNGTILIACLLRSSVDSAKDDLVEAIHSNFALSSANIKFEGGYPGWKPNMNSAILKTAGEVYQKKFGKVPEVKAIHAGLECGLLGGVYPNLDMLSFGPTIRYPHSPDEKALIPSVQKFWDFLVEVIKNAPLKK
ncbi:MAG: cytosol nonspecific dipeptidase [Bacteroidetes bacterium GWA2_32_17]|nr:MAG: cytosol nonspecific dipeptidase [Bacteroidetes bacterium GWA2_32_17]